MPLVVLPGLIPDIPAIYDCYFAAFEGQPILDALFPAGHTGEEFRKGHTAHTIEWWKTASQQHTLKCLDTETGNIVGMATYDVYWKERTYEEWKSPEITWLQGKEKERCEAILKPLWKAKEKLWEGRPHVYCQVVAVHPDHQRKGVGALLMQWGIELGDKLNLPVYLESSEQGVGLYRKLGFEELNEKVVHKPEVVGTDKEVVVPLMVKMPPAAAGMTYNEWAEKDFPAKYRGEYLVLN